MDTLVKLGAAGATPFVVEYILNLLGQDTKISLASWMKNVISLCVGVVLAFLIAVQQKALPVDFSGYIALLVNGIVSGAMATAGVSLLYTAAGKAAANPLSLNIQQPTAATAPVVAPQA